MVRYLIHQPYRAENEEALQTAWKAMESIKNAGKAKSIGVSNFLRSHMESILSIASIVPSNNQIEYHPYLQRGNDYLPWLASKGIKVTSFHGLAPLRKAAGGPLDGPLKSIAEKHGVSEDAVLIKWQIENGVVPITTTTKKERLEGYLKALDLELTKEELEEITKIGLSHHVRTWQPQRFEADDRS
jgi:diketogulonate reductase-like aldo/keto reductase